MKNVVVKVPVGYYFHVEANLPVVHSASSVVEPSSSNMTVGVALLPSYGHCQESGQMDMQAAYKICLPAFGSMYQICQG